MKFLARLLLKKTVDFAGRESAKKLITTVAHYAGLDLLLVAYNNMGILKFENAMVSGEQFFVAQILKGICANVEHPVIFDVGANVGEYSKMIKMEIPQARIHAFEPNISTFNQLLKNSDDSINCVNLGMGAEEKTERLLTYADDLSSSHASVHGEVLRIFHRKDDLVEVVFQQTTIDCYCMRENIRAINFLKIDTEGNELYVLKGAKKMLADGKVDAIQFEFGECDVFSRVFLRDFYELLPGYDIYRLDSQRLIPMLEYNSTNEIFRYQNLVAIRRAASLRVEY